jgi:hypothetical protein
MARLAVALSLAALPLGAAACGGSKHAATTAGEFRDAAAAVRAAARKSVSAGSEHVSIAATATANGQTVTLAGAGDFDSKSGRGTLHANVTLGGIRAAIDEVLDGSTAYVGSPLLASFLPAGKSWLKVDLAAAGKAFGIDTSVLRAQDPGVALAQLKALRNVRRVGSATIGGAAVTRYRGTVDVAKLPQGSAGLLAATGAKLGPVDVWVGVDGYVRRERLSTRTTSSGSTARTTVTTTLSHYGESVLVTVPPAAQAVDAGKVAIPGLGS